MDEVKREDYSERNKAMKYYVDFYTYNRAGSKTLDWGIVEFNFRSEISKDSIRERLVPDYEKNFRVVNMVKL